MTADIADVALAGAGGTFEFVVEREAVARFAAATDDPDPLHLNGESVPVTYAVAPLVAAASSATLTLEAAGIPAHHAARGHVGEHQIIQHRPMAPDTVLRGRSAVTGRFAKRFGTLVVNRVDLDDAEDRPVSTQYTTVVIPGLHSVGDIGRRAPHGVAAPQASPQLLDFEHRFAPDVTYRYAEVTGDHMPLEDHGDMATIYVLPFCAFGTVVARLVNKLRPNPVTHVSRVRARFGAPTLVKDSLRLSAWAAPQRFGGFGFEASRPDGELTLTSGCLEFKLGSSW